MTATKIRHVRVPDTLWLQAAEKAKGEGRTIAEVIRALLVGYIKGD